MYQLSPVDLRPCSTPLYLFLIFYLEDLSIFDSGALKSLNISVLLSISFLKSSKNFLMYLGAPMSVSYTHLTLPTN